MADSPEPKPGEEIQADRVRLEKVAQASPRAAVMEAFALADNALKARLVERRLTSNANALGSTQAIILAQKEGLIDAGSAAAWNNLRALSNAARHEERFDVDRRQVADYIAIATALRAIIEGRSTPTLPPRFSASRREPRERSDLR